MLDTVASTNELKKVSYFKRGDGLADARIRTDIKKEVHPASAGMAEYTEWTAKEAHIVTTLTEQEVIEQADQLLQAYEEEHTPDKERIAANEQAILDNSDAITEVYEAVSALSEGGKQS